jgi:hypothetical protein
MKESHLICMIKEIKDWYHLPHGKYVAHNPTHPICFEFFSSLISKHPLKIQSSEIALQSLKKIKSKVHLYMQQRIWIRLSGTCTIPLLFFLRSFPINQTANQKEKQNFTIIETSEQFFVYFLITCILVYQTAPTVNIYLSSYKKKGMKDKCTKTNNE